jgi:Fur family ferric uptake transcriptional regulator
MTDFEGSLREKGYRLTGQRQIIWHVLLENTGAHLSPKEIWEMAREKDETLAMATVYRTIQLMDGMGVVASFDREDQPNKYELITGEGSAHPHLICQQCGKIIGITEDLLKNNLTERIHDKYDFRIEDIRVKCYGLCAECARKTAK